MLTSRFLIILYCIAGFGAIALCGKMISSIRDIAPEKIITVRSETAILYNEPSEGSLSLLTLEKGDKLEYVRTEGEWIVARNGAFEGYIRLALTSENGKNDNE